MQSHISEMQVLIIGLAINVPSKAGDLRNKPQNMEYVIPIKISPPPLHEDDLLYGGEDWDMSPSWTLQPGKAAPVKDGTKPALRTPLHVETGHFRHKAAELWDPHPQYKFTAFGHVFHLLLAQDSSFVAPNLQVMHLWHNYTTREKKPLHATACFYTGKVSGEPQSSVAVNLCHGMTGHIRTSSGNYFIEPMERTADHTKSIVHAMYIVPTHGMATNNTADYDSHRCGFTGEEDSTSHKDEWHAPINERSKRAAPRYNRNGRKKRPKRREYVVEVMVVADKKMAEYHGSELKDYVLTLMSIVAKLYKDPSIGNPISIAVVTLVDGDFQFVSHDTSPYGRKHDGTSATALMRSFCSWQKKHNPYDDSHPKHHDTALLLTRENICRSPSEYKCETLGLAELGTMCDTNSSCAIVQDNGLSAAFTIAHEIGHVLNMPHDDAEECKIFSNSHITNNVMSRMLDGTTSPWSWSACSRHFLTEYLEAGKAGCLLDSPSNSRYNTEFSPYNLPGENFTVDRQCELVFGAGSRNCSYMPVCERLWCTTGLEENQGCRTKHMPWADGTTCSKGKWCQRGVCVPRDRYALMPVNGSWGPWQKYGECSRTCGGGVKRSIRECNNPSPANGGRYCMGPRMRFQSCATKECPKGAKDFRELQCAAYNNNTFGFRGLPKDVKWVPKYGTSPEERCKLYCRVMHSSSYYRLKDKVIDGTLCGPDTFDICVNGMCKSAGCNHELGSKAKLDMCGQCNGNNTSCQRIVGSFNISKDGYNDVVRIPVGSINVDVRQTGYQGSNADGNYLALLDGTTREYILNGGFVLTVFRKIMSISGVKLEYSGSSAVIERLNSSKPLKKDIIIQILSVGKHPPDINYEYMIRCHWKHNDTWTKCDRPCSGNMYRKPVCALLDGNEGVPESCCAEMPKPRPQIKHCNTHCSIRWRKTPITACSSSCGRGYRTVSFHCVQEFPNHQSRTINNSICAQHFPIPSTTEECEEPCKGQWKFGEWGVCTKTCGGGYQYRLVECVNESGRPINESLCDSSERITKQACSREACLHWELGEWTPCSVSCGVGERHRSYWCTLNNLIVSPQECRMLPIPSYRERCSVDYCSVDRTGSWQQIPARPALPVRRDPCAKCGLPVFIAERLLVGGRILYHRSCFRCARCQNPLSLANCYETEDGQYCCLACPDEVENDTSSKSALSIPDLNDQYSAEFESALEDSTTPYQPPKDTFLETPRTCAVRSSFMNSLMLADDGESSSDDSQIPSRAASSKDLSVVSIGSSNKDLSVASRASSSKDVSVSSYLGTPNSLQQGSNKSHEPISSIVNTQILFSASSEIVETKPNDSADNIIIFSSSDATESPSKLSESRLDVVVQAVPQGSGSANVVSEDVPVKTSSDSVTH